MHPPGSGRTGRSCWRSLRASPASRPGSPATPASARCTSSTTSPGGPGSWWRFSARGRPGLSRVLDARGDPPDPHAVAAAVEALREGDIVGLPTDTVYGLAADPWHSGASDRLFRVKRRPRNVELVLFVDGVEQALAVSEAVPAPAMRLMEQLWPGGLTIVLPRRAGVEADLGEEDATIGVRCPAHPVPLAIACSFGPFATTSANLHGEPPAIAAEELAVLQGVTLVLDGGTCDEEPSSVVDATGEVPRLIRAGCVPWDRVLEVALGS